MLAQLIVTSAAFAASATIPIEFTCQGADRSPPVAWAGAPEETLSFALICDDPDAPVGTWTHWVAFNIPADRTSLDAGVEKRPVLDGGAQQGLNSWKKHGYGGPCPPKRHGPHRYFFRVYALDTTLDLSSSTRREDLLKAIEGHVLAQGELMGTFER